MHYTDYNQVKQIDLKELNEILTIGDAQERVWAAWEIGLRVGKDALPNISLQAHEAPDPGTRRHMVVILAGLGYDTVLTTLAFSDPDESVRGTIAQYLIRTSKRNDDKKADLIIDLLKKDRSPLVKESILTEWNFGNQSIPLEILLKCAENYSEDVRKAALIHIIDKYRTKDCSKDKMIRCLNNQETKGSIYLFCSWLLKWGDQKLIIMAATKNKLPSRLYMLDFLLDKDLKFSWSALKELSELQNPDIDIRLLNLLILEPTTDILLWLAFGITRSINLPKIKSRSQYLEQQNTANFYHTGKNHFLSILKDVHPHIIQSKNAQNFVTILANLENDIESFEFYDDEDYWEEEGLDSEEYIREMNFYCDLIRKWLQKNDL